MTREVFAPFPAAPALARLPLLPVTVTDAAELSPESPDPLVAEGTFLASRQAGALTSGTGTGPPGSRGAATVRSYTLRARSRPTPHGVFAGVAAASFSGRGPCSLRLGDEHRARTMPSPGWLAALCAEITEDPDFLPLLTLSASNLATRRGGRLELERPAVPGATGPQRVTVRATDATLLIMGVCATGASWNAVLGAVTNRWPAAPESAVLGAVLELLRHGFLLSDLLPEPVTDDPLGHLLRKLPPGSPVRGEVAVLRRHMAAADACPPGAPERLTALKAARETADRVISCERPWAVDVAVDAHLVLPAALADEAASAAGVLWRIGSGPDPAAGYHDRFVSRYGRNRFVRLLDAADPVTGIGTDLGGPGHDERSPSAAALALLITAAARDGSVEAELDAATVTALAGGNEGGLPPRTAEVYVRVLADSAQDAAAGRLYLAVCPGGATQDAGSSSGRFASLLPALRLTDGGDGQAAVAELVVQSRTSSGATLAPPTGFAEHRIPIGVPARAGDLGLDDLLLVSDGQRLLLWSAALGRGIVPVLYSRLSPHLLPPVAVLLRALGHHGSRPWRAWSWGPLAGTPFQPRIRYGPTILAPARWTLPDAVTRAAGRPAEWDAALDAWRTATIPAPPEVIVVHDRDRPLPLDLRRPDDRALLRRYVGRGAASVTEQPGGPTAIQGVVAGPAGQHILELVVPLARAQPSPAQPVPPAAAARTARRPGAGLHLPGSSWLSLAIRTPAACQDEVLARVSALAAGFGTQWFWLRYSDHAGPHLRVRFHHADPAHLGGQVLPAMASLAGDLIGQRLARDFSVEPYEQETERYGGSAEAMAAAERVFAADSRVALAILAATPDAEQRIIVASLSAEAIARAVAAGDRAALDGHHVDRAARRRLAGLRPRARAASRSGSPGLAMIPPAGPAWTAREHALAAYRTTLDPAQYAPCASSLIHMHVNRVLGATAQERIVRALAADLLCLPRRAQPA